MQQKDTWYQKLALFAFPIFYFCVYWRISYLRGPFFANPNHDPAYAYLGNMLNIALLKIPQHTDHPGTPVQMLGAFGIKIIYFISSSLNITSISFRKDVLTYPETYLSILHFYFLFIAFLALGILGFVAFQLTGDLILCCILQTISVFLYSISFPQFFPEVLQLASAQLIGILLIFYLYRPGVSSKLWFQLALGGMIGLGIAIKFTFLPFILLVALIPGIVRKILTFIVVLLSFLIFTLPIASSYFRIFFWLTRLASRSGTYGKGETTWIEPSFFKSLPAAFSQSPNFFILYLAATSFLFIVLGIKALKFVFWRKTKANASSSQSADLSGADVNEQYSLQNRALFGSGLIVAVFWFQMAMTLGQNSGLTRYLLPAMTLSNLLIFCLLVFVLQALRLRNSTASYVKVLALVFCIVASIPGILEAGELAKNNFSILNADLNAIQEIQENSIPAECVVIQAKGIKPSTISAARAFLNVWSGSKYTSTLWKIDPDYFSLSITPQKEASVSRFGQESQPLSEFFKENPCAFLRYSFAPYSRDLSQVSPIVPEIRGFTLKSVYRGKVEALDRLELA